MPAGLTSESAERAVLAAEARAAGIPLASARFIDAFRARCLSDTRNVAGQDRCDNQAYHADVTLSVLSRLIVSRSIKYSAELS